MIKRVEKRKRDVALPQSDAISRIVSASESCSTIMSTFLVPEEDTHEIKNVIALIGQYAVNYLYKELCRT
ncbi:hypothetical protein HN873_011521, partial [Arachis hypogaea]